MEFDYLDELGRALYLLVRHGPGLDGLLEPRQAPSGENAGRAPARRGSRPPLSVPVLDVKVETERMLGRWCGQLVRDAPEVGRPPLTPAIAARADWLRGHLEVLEKMPWMEAMSEEVAAQERIVTEMVMPPSGDSDPLPLEVGTVREIVSWADNLGYPVSRSTVRRWVAAGELEAYTAPDGRVLVRLADVLSMVSPAARYRCGPPAC